MLHPALARALATAQVEDQLRSAARWRTIRLARQARAIRGGDEALVGVASALRRPSRWRNRPTRSRASRRSTS